MAAGPDRRPVVNRNVQGTATGVSGRSRKIILCRCEDVTLADVHGAVATGFADLEEVKRYTGFGTGLCQGRECQRAVAAVLAAIARPDVEAAPVAELPLAAPPSPPAVEPFTSRPPLFPTELRRFAARPRRR
jgi:sarcosine oxidase subunit beta